ncbi:NAD(P)-binding protein [Aureobasidium pullulans]|uniref:NAD(P)-binding protein n=1 Tax=Aureobasidium pullulans TaxID=5580 RepID=A0A4S9LWV2_AURPU|nr:NAD(P)-binding protein [Aureobasidium pullulans]
MAIRSRTEGVLLMYLPSSFHSHLIIFHFIISRNLIPKHSSYPNTSMAQPDRKIALITGGSQGIGAATARVLVDKCFFVAAKKVIEDLGRKNATSIMADASRVDEIENMVNTVVSMFARIDALIANAAKLGLQDISETTEEGFDALFAINVKGPYFVAQKAAPHMPPGSHIVLLSTTQCHASTVTSSYLLYTMTKGAIEQTARVLAKGLGPKGIFVNTVAPGPTSTELFLNGKSKQLLDTLAGLSPHHRLGQPEDVAEAIGFLTQNQWVSGQVVKASLTRSGSNRLTLTD